LRNLLSSVRTNKFALFWLIIFMLYSITIVWDLFSSSPPQLSKVFIWSFSFNFLLYGLLNKGNILIDKPQYCNSNIDKLANLHYWICILRLIGLIFLFSLMALQAFSSYVVPSLGYIIVISTLLLDSIVYLYRAVTK